MNSAAASAAAPRSRERRTPVLFLDARVQFGGDSRVLLQMLEALDRERFEPVAACPPHGIPGARIAAMSGVRSLSVGYGQIAPGRRSANSILRKIQEILDGLSTLWTLWRTVAGERIPLFHMNNTTRAAAFAILLKCLRLGRIRMIYHAHCDPLPGAVHRIARLWSDEIWCISQYITDHYRQAGVPESQIRFMPNAYDFSAAPGDASGPRAQWKIPADAPVILLTGRLSPRKGQHIALEAFALLRPRNPSPHLIIVGDDSIPDDNAGYLDSLKRRAAQAGLGGQVHFAGFVENVKDYYALADVALICSENEPFGMISLEALAAGKPVISTGSGGLKEVVADTAGYPTIERTPEAFAAALDNFLDHGPAIPAAEARERAARRFGFPGFRARLNQALEQLIQSPQGEKS